MTLISRLFLILAAAVGLNTTALGQDHGTKEEAIAMANAAVAHIQKVGQQKALDDFMNDKSAWSSKDLYVFVMDFQGVNKSHGANAKLVGKNLMGLKDKNGKEFVKEMVAVGSTKSEGWVDYDWANPTSKKIEGKSTLVKRVAGAELLVGVGIYR
jgi:cytochrome c